MYRSIPGKRPCTAFHGFNIVASFYTKYVPYVVLSMVYVFCPYLIADLTSCMYLSIPTAPDAAASFGAAGVPGSSAPPLPQTHPVYGGVYGHQLTHGHGSSHPFCRDCTLCAARDALDTTKGAQGTCTCTCTCIIICDSRYTR